MQAAAVAEGRGVRHPDTFRVMCGLSLITHMTLLVAAVVLPGAVRETRQPILVTMVSLPGGGAPRAKPAVAPAVAKQAEPKPVAAPEPAKPKLTYPDKSKPAQKKPEPAKKPAAASAAAAAQPAKPAGKLETKFEGSEFSTEIGGEGEGALSNFPFAFYLQRIRDKVSSNWFQGLVVGNVTGEYVVTVFFRILRDGRVADVQVEESSGVESLDLSAQRAVLASTPMPPLPQGYAEDTLNVHFRFHYEK